MKLRIQDNSLRFRVSQSDLTRLVDTGRLDATIYFGTEPGSELTYRLTHSSSAETVRVEASPQTISVVLPSAEATVWAATEQVGIEAMVDLGPRGALAILIEKDFACLDGSTEENVDTFPNPSAAHTC